MFLQVQDESFTYDVYGLVQAFYPYEPLEVVPAGKSREGGSILSVCFSPERLFVLQDGVPIGETGVGDVTAAESAGRRELKNRLKRMLYDALSERTGRTLPWGTLTGIRPTKIPLTMLSQGRREEEIASYMQATYLCSPEKIRLSIDIAKRELSVLGDMGDGYALYIGVPFCPSICLYCSFSSYPIGVYQNRVEAYLEALERELAFVGETFAHRRLDMVYVGGGTPTSLSAGQLARLFDALHRHLDTSGLREFTVEAGRPDSITEEKLCVLKEAGVGRISINPQTMQQRTLDVIGRIHTVEQVEAAYRMARGVGFLINMDTIIGLPGEGEADVLDTLSRIGALAPDNLTVHSLAIKRSSRLSEHLGEYDGALLRNSEALMQGVAAAAAGMGMRPYYLYRQKQISGNMENVGYAPTGKECLYNIGMMEELMDVVALGPGSVSKRVARQGDAGAVDMQQRISRCENVKDVDTYLANLDEMINRKRRLFFSVP